VHLSKKPNRITNPVLSQQNQFVKLSLSVFVVQNAKKRHPKLFLKIGFDLIAQNILRKTPYGVFFCP
jgi:hypothetical protein